MATPAAGGFLTRMTQRERVYVLALVLVFFFMSSLLLWYFRSGAVDSATREVTAIRAALDQVHTRGAVYTARLAKKKEREATLASEALLFGTLVEEASQAIEGVVPTNEEELPALELGDGLVKRSYKFSLRGITLEALTKFIVKVESKVGHVILTENLKITSSSGEDRLNAELTIATWERREVAPEAVEAPEEERP